MKTTKKLLAAALILIMAVLILPPTTVHAAQSEIRVIIDGQVLNTGDTAPIMIDGRVMVPMRPIFEALGATVGFDSRTQTITANIICGCVVVMRIGSTAITVNGNPVAPMDVAPRIINDRTMVPLRFVAQTLNSEVVWDRANNAALINTDPFTRIDPRPVTLTFQPLSWRQVGDWIIHYLHTGGISALEREVVELVNIERARVGAPPLAICPLLSAAARFKSQEMADLNYVAHDSPVYGAFYNIPRNLFGADHIRGENLMGRFLVRPNNAEFLVESWMGSPGHRDNMLNPNHAVIGVGVVIGPGIAVNLDGRPILDRDGLMATQMFGVSPGNLGDNALMDMYIRVTIERYGVEVVR